MITKQMLYCIEHNGIYPQDIQLTTNQYATFGPYGLSITKMCSRNHYEKHINGYRNMTAEEINKAFCEMKWSLVN